MKLTPIELMSLALEQGRLGGRNTKPNPRVGASLEAVSGQVVSGYHQKAGQAHAEIEVLNECKRFGVNTKGAQIAVTLEPCSHQGKTGPCADALIKAEVSKVIVGIRDPHRAVNGQGIEKLKSAGIEVVESILAKECFDLNREWMIAQKLGRPYITVKMATSLDGKWATESGESKWITGEKARNHAHHLRARVDAIGTSFKTIKIDDAQFTARPEGNELEAQPKLVVFSSKDNLNFQGLKAQARKPIVVDSSNGLTKVLEKLFVEYEIADLMIEAGPTLTTAFLKEQLFDELWLYQAPKILGGDALNLGAFNEGKLPGLCLQLLRQEILGEDRLLVFCPKSNLS